MSEEKEMATVGTERQGSDSFEQIINLVSEIVVIKARLQQLMDSLVTESRDSKQVKESINGVSLLLHDFEKTTIKTNDKNLQKEYGVIRDQFDGVVSKMTNSLMSSLVLDLDEVTGRFGKVLGELQGVLMNMRTGSSAIAIMQVLLVKINQGIFAFPLESVLEIVKIKLDEVYSVDGNETIRLREHALGLVSLEETIGIKANEKSESDERRVVVISNGQDQIGIVVDALLGEEDIVAKKLSGHFRRVRGIGGASILGDGQVALILDVAQVIAQAQTV